MNTTPAPLPAIGVRCWRDRISDAASTPARPILLQRQCEDLVARQSIDVQADPDRVLHRNQELHRRLA